jgi:hypothetical protein
MNRLCTCFPLLLVALLVSLTSLSVSAQTPSAGALPALDELNGIEAAVSRTYGVDLASMMTATPGLGPEDVEPGVSALSALVLKFDNDESARSAYEAFSAGIGTELLEMGQGGTPTVSDETLDDLGGQASAATLHTKTEDLDTFYRFVLVQDGQYFFLVSALAGTEDDVAIADELARYVTDEGEEEGDQAIVVAEGGSSGGLWGFMPDADHELLDGLVPIMDETLYPAP